MWELDGGKKDRRLFQKAMKTLDQIARQTHDLRLFTDGERRYGHLLFEICYELVKAGRPGRPKKTCKKGVHCRSKHPGSQAHKKGRKRPKYPSPWQEHPETTRTMAETDIHAKHAEAFLSALRRHCATFRRKTNMDGCQIHQRMAAAFACLWGGAQFSSDPFYHPRSSCCGFERAGEAVVCA